MGGASSTHVPVQGHVAPGFESVKKMFEENFRKGADTNAQLCVYVGEEKVIDLWGKADENSEYDGDTLTTVFSSTKSLTAIAMAALQDQGLISYDEKITTYWPEFGQNGKENVKVCDLMRHEAGLANPHTPIPPESTLRENIKKNAIGAMYEKETMEFPSYGKREYHALTRGWVANEIFRRADKRKRTLGEFLAEEVAAPLNADINVGFQGDCSTKYHPCMEVPFGTVLGDSIKRSFGSDSSVEISFGKLLKLLNMFRGLTSRPALEQYKDQDMKKIGPLFNLDVMRKGETSSANGNCSARGLAKVAAAMANKGTFNGVQILSNKAWEALHSEPTYENLWGLLPTNFTQGGVEKFTKETGREGYYGWFGYGGSVFQWNPELRVGFAFVPTSLHWYDMTNTRGKMLQQEVVKCVKNRQL